ncbi:hypothetical protein QBC39DRAFT_42613 [Podospora conica]|nr:hypothetical protein QBC39DRAFT_42613 [Schizothecium conicum]
MQSRRFSPASSMRMYLHGTGYSTRASTRSTHPAYLVRGGGGHGVDGVLTAHRESVPCLHEMPRMRPTWKAGGQGAFQFGLLWLNLLLSCCRTCQIPSRASPQVPRAQEVGLPVLSGIGPSEQQIEAQTSITGNFDGTAVRGRLSSLVSTRPRSPSIRTKVQVQVARFHVPILPTSRHREPAEPGKGGTTVSPSFGLFNPRASQPDAYSNMSRST